VIRSVLVNQKNKAEVIPVDYAINGLIVIPYEFNKQAKRPANVPVYNITNERKKGPSLYQETSAPTALHFQSWALAVRA